MLEFYQVLINPDIPFIRYAMLTGLLASVAFGIIGTYVISRRISYIAGAISHSVLGGIGLGLFLELRMGWPFPMVQVGALAAALTAALVIGLVTIHGRQREDTVIGAVWSIGMAIGLIFLSQTPGYIDPMSYLFGNILLLTVTDIWLALTLDVVIVLVSLLCYRQFLAICFDEEFARVRGLRVNMYYLLLLVLTSLTVVLMVRMVGIILVIALLTLPAAVAGLFARSLKQMMLLAIAGCMAYVSVGIALSYLFDLPTGTVIILVAGITYLLAMLGKRWCSS